MMDEQDMRIVPDRKEWTTKALKALPRDGRKYEVFDGELLVSPTGFHHGYISSRVLAALMAFALEHRLGLVVDSSTGFRLSNHDCLSPDVSFVRKERFRKGITQRFFQGAPDLAVEVLSPGESQASVSRKLAAYFREQTRLAWVVNPKERTVRVYRSAKLSKRLHSKDCLVGEDLLPGFRLPVASLFELPNFDRS